MSELALEGAAGGVGHWQDWRQHVPITVGAPAAGSGFTHAVPGATFQRVRVVSFLLTTDGNAASRLPRVEFLNAAGDVFAAVAAPFTLAASLAARFTFGIGLNQYGANNAAQIGGPLPDVLLESGLAVRVAIASVQAGDQVSGSSLFVDQYPVRD